MLMLVNMHHKHFGDIKIKISQNLSRKKKKVEKLRTLKLNSTEWNTCKKIVPEEAEASGQIPF